MDCLTLSNLELWTHIGVPDEERQTEQRILVTLDMFLDVEMIAKSDNLTDGIDYFLVVEHLKKLALEERKTIEHFADKIASSVLDENPLIDHLRVTVKKFPLPGLGSASVTIERQRS